MNRDDLDEVDSLLDSCNAAARWLAKLPEIDSEMTPGWRAVLLDTPPDERAAKLEKFRDALMEELRQFYHWS
jgi:hypothetical protein